MSKEKETAVEVPDGAVVTGKKGESIYMILKEVLLFMMIHQKNLF